MSGFIVIGVDNTNEKVDGTVYGTMEHPGVHGIPVARCASVGDENFNCLDLKNSSLKMKLIKICYYLDK